MKRALTRVEIQFLALLYRVMKSTAFTIFMMVFGFFVGVVSVACHYRYMALRNSNNEFIAKIEQKMDDFDDLDEKYESLQKEIRAMMKEAKVKLTFIDEDRVSAEKK